MASLLSGLFGSPVQKEEGRGHRQKGTAGLRIDTDAQPDNEDVDMDDDYGAADMDYQADLEHEHAKRLAATKRWNGNISPEDEAFQTVLETFRQEMANQNKSISRIIKTYFTSHEESLLVPANKRTNPSLVKLQAANKKRYQALLASPRFQAWSDRADLAFKFTLVHFGLPVAPMAADFGQKLELRAEESDDEDEVAGSEPLGGHLRFLNSYNVRLFSNDSGRVPDPTLEAYYGLGDLKPFSRGQRLDRSRHSTMSVSLRGGGSADDDATDDVLQSGSPMEMDPNAEASMALANRSPTRSPSITHCGHQASLRGGKGDPVQSTYPGILGIVDDNVFGGRFGPWEDIQLKSMLQRRADEDPEAPENWLPLYGTQGIVWFDLNTLETFVDAVDRLLGLDTRAGLSYTISIYDKSADYSDQVARNHWEMADVSHNVIIAGEGDFSRDDKALHWLRRVLPKNPRSMKNWAIYASAVNDAYPSWSWDPKLAGEDVISFTMSWKDGIEARPDVAYLSVPKNVKRVLSSNIYGPWMAQIIRLLTPGRLPGRPGKPTIPDAFFNLTDTLAPEVAAYYTYGGLHFPPEAWDDINEQYDEGSSDGNRTRELLGRHGNTPDSALQPSTCLKIFMPGYNENPILVPLMIDHVALGDQQVVWKTITDIVRHSLAESAYNDMQAIEVWTPGDSFFLESKTTRQTVPIMAGGGAVADNAALLSLCKRLAQWRDWLNQQNRLDSFPQFITIRPVFKQYTLGDEERPTKNGTLTPFDLGATSLAQLRDLVKSIWESKPRAVEYKEDQVSISVKQPIPYNPDLPVVSVVRRLDKVYSYKPDLLIMPETTEEEWGLLCKLITSPNLAITVVDSEKVIPSFEDTQSFGFGNIYDAPDDELYAGSGGVRPQPAQYFDWQLWEKNALLNHATVPPVINATEPVPPPSQSSLNRKPQQQTGKKPGKQDARVHFDLTSTAYEGPSGGRQSALSRKSNRAQNISNPRREHYMSDQELAQAVRRYAFDNRLSVQDYRTVPINAPPLEQVLDLRNPNVPVVSLAVLTPTEVRRLQINHYDMRNLALDRIQKCPYRDCNETFSMLVPRQLQNHVALKHTLEKCNFCNDYLYQHWTAEQRLQHFIAKHRNQVTLYKDRGNDMDWDAVLQGGTDLKTASDLGIGPSSYFFSERESRWHYCARCGRDHHVLNARQDRGYHDAMCRPGKGIEINIHKTWKVCEDCGGRVDPSVVDRGVQHAHRDNVPQDEAPYCEDCGIALGQFGPAYQDRHRRFCQGQGFSLAAYCPWCSIRLPLNLQGKINHLSGCDKLPAGNPLGPIDLQKGVVVTEPGQEYSRLGEAQDNEPDRNAIQEEPAADASTQKSSRLSTIATLSQKLKEKMSGRAISKPKNTRQPAKSTAELAKYAPTPRGAQASTAGATGANTLSKKRRRGANPDGTYKPDGDDDDDDDDDDLTDEDEIEAVRKAQNFATKEEARRFLKRRRVHDPNFRPTTGEDPADIAAEPTAAAVSKDAESLLDATAPPQPGSTPQQTRPANVPGVDTKASAKGNGATTSLFRKGFESNLDDLKRPADRLGQTTPSASKPQTRSTTRNTPAKTK